MKKPKKVSAYAQVALRVSDIKLAEEIVARLRLAGDAGFGRTNSNYEYPSTFVGLVIRNAKRVLAHEPLDSQAIRAAGFSPTDPPPKPPLVRALLRHIVEQLRFEARAIDAKTTVLARDYSSKPILWMVPIGTNVHLIGTDEAARLVVKLARTAAPVVLDAEPNDTLLHYIARCTSPTETELLAAKITAAFCPPAPKAPEMSAAETYYNEPPI